MRRHDAALGTGREQGVLQHVNGRAVDTVGRQDRDPARADAMAGPVGHAQRRRRRQAVVDWLRFELRRVAIGRHAAVERPLDADRYRHAEAIRHPAGQRDVDVMQQAEHAFDDRGTFNLAEFELQRLDQMFLLPVGKAVEEHDGLAEVIEELVAALAHLGAADRFPIGRKAAIAAADLHRTTAAQRVRPIGHATPIDRLAMHAIALVVVQRTQRPVDRDLVKVRASEARQLGIGVREQSAGQQRVVAEIDAGHDVAGVKGDLLGLGEVVVDIAVQGHLADPLHRHHFLGNQLGGVQQVEREAVFVFLGHDLHAEFPFREIAIVDRVPQVAAMEVRILSGDLQRFRPDHRMHAEQRLPVELHEARAAIGGDEAEAVHAEAFHHSQASRNGPVGHHPHDHVQGFRRQRNEIPECVVRRGGLWNLVVRLRLHGVDQVWKLDRVLDEEHRHVVADEVVIAFRGVELHREATHVARQIRRATRTGHRRETHEHRRFNLRVLQERGARDRCLRRIDLEYAVGGDAACMDDTLGNPFVIEVGDLLAKDEVFEQRRATFTGLEAVLVVEDRQTLIAGQPLSGSVAG